MIAQGRMTVELSRHVNVAPVRKSQNCQSPLVCGRKATRWNERERKYLCDHCQEILNELQTGISVSC